MLQPFVIIYLVDTYRCASISVLKMNVFNSCHSTMRKYSSFHKVNGQIEAQSCNLPKVHSKSVAKPKSVTEPPVSRASDSSSKQCNFSQAQSHFPHPHVSLNSWVEMVSGIVHTFRLNFFNHLLFGIQLTPHLLQPALLNFGGVSLQYYVFFPSVWSALGAPMPIKCNTCLTLSREEPTIRRLHENLGG